MVIEIIVARGPRRTVAAMGRDSTVLVPLSGFMRLAELEVSSIRSDSALVGALHAPSRDLVIDTHRRTVTLADSTMPLGAGDAVWSNGVLHATGDTPRAIAEARRVLKPGGRAMISHFYRKPSWMYWMNRFGRENIEYKEEDPPVNEFYTEREIEAMFEGFEIVDTAREHHRALPVRRSGLKAFLYTYGFKPAYNLLPDPLARRLAYKYSVTAVRI